MSSQGPKESSQGTLCVAKDTESLHRELCGQTRIQSLHKELLVANDPKSLHRELCG